MSDGPDQPPRRLFYLKLMPAEERERVETWSLTSRAIHYDLLFASWLGRTLPDDNAKLAKIARCSSRQIAASREELLAEEWRVEAGCWRMTRLEEARKRALEISADKSRAGKSGANATHGARQQGGQMPGQMPEQMPATVPGQAAGYSSSMNDHSPNQTQHHHHHRAHADADAELRDFESWLSDACQRVSGRVRIPHKGDRAILRRWRDDGVDLGSSDFRSHVENLVMRCHRAHGSAPTSLSYFEKDLKQGGAS